ncbi:T9SS type A sorting domain-containing protein [Haliscomenobacter hydrossis]|uniref:Uncharacterized protein n=1 Tax=Haliscomenobacter hydrossis (strain ATCC 27775 / DSM 1100 / LMG 10767 / O) TaxID=760192 RepID=F4L4P2_HALH1|nr:T9SS type A sorting domain-containing protein [Haliscomenobacter hydrossis]AEE52990.1 hypothetical protein Halhy_5164 [Haliscomenobacter hydrossis DSM 1100]
MKKFFTIIFTLFFSYSCWAGDVVFTLVNSDGTNVFAFVATTNISAGTVIYFTENEWTGGNAGTAFNTGEGIIAYTVPAGGLSEGTVVSIDADGATSSNGGTVVESGSFDIANGVDPVYAYYGTNATTVTEILSVFRDAAFLAGEDPTGNSLAPNLVIIALPSDQDNAQYTGTRSFITLAAAITALTTASNWTQTDGGGDQAISPNTTSFTFAPVCNISNLSFGNVGNCSDNGTGTDLSDDYFTADITVTYSEPVGSGTLDLTGDVLVGGGDLSVVVGSLNSATSHTFTGVRLKADGTASAVTATFSANVSCTASVSNGPSVAPCSVPALSAIATCAGISAANENTYNIVINGLNPDETYTINIDGTPNNGVTGVSSFTSPTPLTYGDGTEGVVVIITPNAGSPINFLVHEVLCTDADDDGDLDFNTAGCDVDLDAENIGYIVATVAPYVGENVYLYILTNSSNQAIAANNSGLFTNLPEGQDYHVVALNFVDEAEADAYLSDLILDPEDGTIIDGATAPGDCGQNCGIATYDINCFVCPSFSNVSADQTICDVADLEDITVQIDQNAIDVKFVYFATAQAGTAMYAGGTPIGNTQTPAGGDAPYTATAAIADLPSAPGTYYVYAILDTTDPDLTSIDCRPSAEIVLTIPALPSAEFSYSSTAFCTADTVITLSHTMGGIDGIYTATPAGLVIDKYTGLIDIPASAPGNYTVTNTIPANGTIGDLVITGVIDGPLTGGIPKAIELYVINDIPNLGIYSVKSAFNGSASFTATYTLSGSATAGQYLYLATESAMFNTFFGFNPTFVNGSVPNINGDDVIGLFRNADLIDQFGELGVDGSGQPWDYLDGWAYRSSNGYGPDGRFLLDNWSFSGINALDGEATNATADNPFPIATYKGGLGCADVTASVEVSIFECVASIEDPCVCENNAPIIQNGTYSNEGTFKDVVRITGPAGLTWKVSAVTGLYTDVDATNAVEVDDLFIEVSPGVYELEGYHVDSIGYSVTVANGRGTELSSSNKCYYPDPVFTGLPGLVAPNAAPFMVTGTVANGATGTGTFRLDGNNQPGASAAPTQLTINPATLALGEHTLDYSFDADTASNDLSDPGCVKTVRQTFQVANCGCQDVTVTLDANCQFRLAASLISDADCSNGTVRVMDNNPRNGDIIDCAGVWTYGLFDSYGNIICWGKVTAEDKTGPAFVCANWFKDTLDCYDVDYVLNNPRTIGNIYAKGTTFAVASPRGVPGNAQTFNNAEGRFGDDGVGLCDLVPFAGNDTITSDNILNLGYTYFKDNCRDCGCRTTLRWSDKVVFYSCEETRLNGGIYAKIFREWVATDCNGMRSDTVQVIPFARPELDEFVFNGTGEGKYDQVVTYSSCTPNKELIQKADVTPFICSYFNTRRNPRCLYLDEIECNYSVSIKDTEFPVCGGKGLKIDREMYVFDWCTGKIVDTFHILIKIGDFEAPGVTYAHHAPYVISTGPMDCTAAFPVTIAGIKSAFGVSIVDSCQVANLSVSVYTKDRYVKGLLVNEGPESPYCAEPVEGDTCCIAWEKVEYAIMNGQMIGVPVGKHFMKIEAFDGCYNSSTLCFPFEVKDKIAPVMKCDDDLHISLSNANGYVDGYAQVTAADIDEGSWDNCKLAWIAVRRNVSTSCTASFIQKGYDSNGNGKIDAAPFDDPKDAPANWKWIVDGKEVVDGIDNNGDGDIFDRGEFFATKGGKIMTPLQDAVDFFCCDLAERVTIELWGADTADNPATTSVDESNWNYCWNDVLIEDKVAPTCVAPWDITVDCDAKCLAQIDDARASTLCFGDVTITSGSDCANLDTVYTVTKNLKCGYGKIVRTWTLTKETAKGPISITCSQTIWVRPIHQYDICFPKDVSSDCKTPIIDTVLTDELSCDILAVNITDKRYDASDDECYKIFRTYTVINWCAYDDRCGDPMAEGNVFVVERSLWENYGKAPIYLLVRDRDRDLDEEFWLSKDLEPNNGDDIYVEGDKNWGGYASLGSRVTTADDKMPSCEEYNNPNDHFQDWEYYHSFMYTQIIKVYDEVAPVVTGIRDTFCTSPTACTANITKVVTIKDNCTDKVTLETQFLMIAPGQTTNAGSMILYSTPRWSVKDLGNGQFEITVTNLTEGTHDLIVVGRDECGNLSVATRIPFTVKDCKAPAPICINGLSTELMPNGSGKGMMTVWANDFVASEIYDCNGQGPETKDGLKLVKKYSINRVGQPVDQNKTSLELDCADLDAAVLVEIHAWDEVGNHDFCITFIEVQDNRKVCPTVTPVNKIKIAGTISTEMAASLQGVTVTLSGHNAMSSTTNAAGDYSFVNLTQGGDFTVTPQLDKNHLNGVSTFDLVLIQKHILGVQALNSPYKLIAADANNSKSISTLDMIQIRKLILNIDQHFANNTSWRFVDATYRFPNPANPWSGNIPEVVSMNDLATNITANFVAIKVGDVNASAVVNATTAEVRTSGAFKLQTTEQALQAGNEYRVAFTAEDLKNIQGYQFALNLDQSKVELVDLEYGVAKAENFGVFTNEGLITTSWNSKYEAGTLFTLVLRAKADAKLSQSINLNRTVSPEAYDQNNENLGIALHFEGIPVSEVYELLQNTPNPFSDETVIRFKLPKATAATLSIRDVKGALLYQVEGNYAKGNNQVILKEEQLRTNGVLYYTLETKDFIATKKMVILK